LKIHHESRSCPFGTHEIPWLFEAHWRAEHLNHRKVELDVLQKTDVLDSQEAKGENWI